MEAMVEHDFAHILALQIYTEPPIRRLLHLTHYKFKMYFFIICHHGEYTPCIPVSWVFVIQFHTGLDLRAHEHAFEIKCLHMHHTCVRAQSTVRLPGLTHTNVVP